VAIEERRAWLERLLTDAREPIAFSRDVDADAQDLLRQACRLHLEGIIGKRLGSRYVSGRTLVNLTASYRLDKHWSFGLNVDNLLNTKYIYSVRSVNVIVPGPEINVKASIDYTF